MIKKEKIPYYRASLEEVSGEEYLAFKIWLKSIKVSIKGLSADEGAMLIQSFRKNN